MLKCYTNKTEHAYSIVLVQKERLQSWLKDQPETVRNWVKVQQFNAESGEVCLVPNNEGQLAQVLLGLQDALDSWALGALPAKLPAGDYCLENLTELEESCVQHAVIAWGLASYQFTLYKEQTPFQARLLIPEILNSDEIINRVRSAYLVRDLINTPTEDLGPPELAEAVEKVANEFNAHYSQIIGDDLLTQGYPAVHTVGRASSQNPRLIDLQWGQHNATKITLVGKGVCFDSGGLNLKPGEGMRDMKKDMGGAAQALGVARAIMAAQLPVRLRLLIPAVENAVSGDAYRPGDIIRTRKGLSVEVANTDAEGRLILADALTEAADEEPELLIDFATLTGAARVALGPDLSGVFTRDESLAQKLIMHGEQTKDPLWRLPLYDAYRDYLKSQFADIASAYTKPYAGATTAALFLESFVPKGLSWVHFDIMASNTQSRPGRPEGGEAMAMHAVYHYIKSQYGKT